MTSFKEETSEEDQSKSYDLYREGLDSLKAGNTEMAEELLRRSWDHSPHFKTAEILGELLFKTRRDLPKAILYLAAAVGLQPSSTTAHLGLVQALAESDDFIGAWKQLERLLAKNPNYKKALRFKEDLEKKRQIQDYLSLEA